MGFKICKFNNALYSSILWYSSNILKQKTWSDEIKAKMIFLFSILRIVSSTMGYQYLIIHYTIAFHDIIAIPLNMCDSIENIKTKNQKMF